MGEISNYLAQQTIEKDKQTLKKDFLLHQTKIKTLWLKYEALEKTMQQTEELFQKIAKKKDSFSHGLSLIQGEHENLESEKEYIIAQEKLNEVKQWALEAYQEIVAFRKFITSGQELLYMVADSKGFSYLINEEEYLKLLSGKLSAGHKSHISKIEQGKLFSFLNLSVGTPSMDTKTIIPPFDLHQDKLFNLLDNNKDYILKEAAEDGLTQARLYELYTQIKGSFFQWKTFESPIQKNISSKRQEKIINEAIRYVAAKMHKDKTPFYATGDAIVRNTVLIENKIGGSAIVSINTIKNAIKNLNDKVFISDASPQQMEQALIKMYTRTGKAGIEHEIQKKTGEMAQKEIQKIIKTIFS